MRYFLILLEYKTDIENIRRVTDQHRLHLKKGYDKGMLLLSGPQVPRKGGVIIAKCNNREELEVFFSEDPYYLNSYADCRYIEFDPKSYDPLIGPWIKD